jgi:hypothetical protein
MGSSGADVKECMDKRNDVRYARGMRERKEYMKTSQVRDEKRGTIDKPPLGEL